MPAILDIAVPTPLRRSFDYLPPPGLTADEAAALKPGSRLLVPFGRRQVVGILLAVNDRSALPLEQLKAAAALLDAQPVLPAALFELACWAANYYHHPIGDALSQMLPLQLRRARRSDSHVPHWQLTTEGKGLPEGALKRAPKQARLLTLLQQEGTVSQQQLRNEGISSAITRALADKGLIEAVALARQQRPGAGDAIGQAPLDASLAEDAPILTREQEQVLSAVGDLDSYQCCLLEGVTGSGKTEVYLQLIARCLERGRQALVLVPEIALTPQALRRFQRRFRCPIALLHSGLSDSERLRYWQQAGTGGAGIVIGTRSAVFVPLARPGLIVVDEEHDASFKQQEGFRYSARDVAIKRAANEAVPIILGSATPSLESLHNAGRGRFKHLHLRQRANGAEPPPLQLLDIRHEAMTEGFSPPLLSAIGDELRAGNQILVFINRRGFAPVLLCHDCGYIAQCPHCDARMTVHRASHSLRCHHCDQQQVLPTHCPDCKSARLDYRGVGTERSEQALQQHFPGFPVLRIDRDTTSRRHALEQLLQQVRSGDPAILVGTQMLAKGHHFPDVTLVAVLDADGGLFSADFRGPEQMGQLLTQVAGRAGRADKPGRVLIQTHQPDHPYIQLLAQKGYHPFAEALLLERQQAGLPPFSHLALIRADGKNLQQAERFLEAARQWLTGNPAVAVLGPLPAPMARRAGRFRAQLLLRSSDRRALHSQLQQLFREGMDQQLPSQLRWSIDIDPLDMF